MNPVLFHIWGPFAIHAYGLCIAIGIMLALWLLSKDDKAQQLMSPNDFAISIQYMIIAGYFGGRIVCMLSEQEHNQDYFLLLKFWEPGFSVLGTIIGISVIMFLFLWFKKIPMLSYTDRIALYAPLVQGFGRIGCFFAGCCYGKSLNSWWAVTYNNPDHMAPLHIPLHPTQLYSSGLLFLIFIFLYFYVQRKTKQPGILLCSYLILVSTERFMVDFWRWDRSWLQTSGYPSYLSTNQWIAIALCLCATSGLIILKYFKKKNYGSI